MAEKAFLNLLRYTSATELSFFLTWFGRSEFESRWVYSFYSVKLIEKNENKRTKRPGMAH